MLTIIVAIDKNNGIGYQGDMPWHLSADLKHFRQTTTPHTIIMGRKTWLSIGEKPLPKRRNIVISTTLQEANGAEIAHSIDEAIELCKDDEQAFIIGGAQIYASAIEKADCLIVTHIDKAFENIDTYFPRIDPAVWFVANEGEWLTDEPSGLDYQIVRYFRR